MSNQSDTLIVCGRSVDGFFNTIAGFHGWKAPGLVMGGFMVDMAQRLIRDSMGPNVEADAIVETRHCLPDAIQLFTPCTFGNGWMKVLDWDKFALCLYNKHTLDGFRIWFDLAKAKEYPNLYNWYMRLVPKKELPLEVLLDSILDANWDVYAHKAVKITDFYQPQKKGEIEICTDCGEAYPTAQGATCLTCQGKGYYAYQDA